MKAVIDPGHSYLLLTLDGELEQILTFVKRCEPPGKYPGNTGHHPGTNVQSVARSLIDRVDYLQVQAPCTQNVAVRRKLLEILWLFEDRAAERHGWSFDYRPEDMDKMQMCPHCGHVVCTELGNAHR